jgi:NADH-quinone oxidoreductase subunit N
MSEIMTIEIPTFSLIPILPALLIMAAGIVVLLLDMFVNNKRLLGFVGMAGVVAAAVAVAVLWPGSDETVHKMAVGDSYALFFNLVFLLTAGLSLLTAMDYLTGKELQGGEYYALLLFSTSGMMVMASATDLLILFVGLEIMSIALYVLVGYNRRQIASVEAAIKYFVLGAFASAFLLYGVALTFGATGSTNLQEIGLWLNGSGVALPRDPMAMIGLALMLVGFAFKVAAVPFQWWTPDVYHGAPTSVTAFMSVGAKVAGFAALLRLLFTAFSPNFTADWMIITAVLAALTMTMGNLAALTQKDVKRMLAYSSIAHAGYILVGVAAGSAAGIQGVLFYAMAYAFTTVGAFAVAAAIEKRDAYSTHLEEYAGLARRMPWLATAMAIFMLSLTGIPPLVGFWGKFLLFRAAVESGMAWLAILGVINSAISAYYYLGVIVQMHMRLPQEETEPATESPAKGRAHAVGAAVLIAALGTIALGIWPGLVVNLAVVVPLG